MNLAARAITPVTLKILRFVDFVEANRHVRALDIP